jgi:hypothetical protein
MSITIEMMGKQAVLADGQWRSADHDIAETLNAYMDSLEIPSHYPPVARERLAAQAMVRDFGARIIASKPEPDDSSSRMPDGRLKVY